MKSWAASTALVAYLALMVDLTLLRFHQPKPGRNLVPLRTIAHDLGVGGVELVINLLGNLAATVPFGFLVPVVFGARVDSAGRVALASFGFSLTIESAQAVSGRRVADVDDLILNTIGGLIGYAILQGWRRWAKRRSESRIRGVSTGGASKIRPPTPL